MEMGGNLNWVGFVVCGLSENRRCKPLRWPKIPRPVLTQQPCTTTLLAKEKRSLRKDERLLRPAFRNTTMAAIILMGRTTSMHLESSDWD